jgi:hypothetical protein
MRFAGNVFHDAGGALWTLSLLAILGGAIDKEAGEKRTSIFFYYYLTFVVSNKWWGYCSMRHIPVSPDQGVYIGREQEKEKKRLQEQQGRTGRAGGLRKDGESIYAFFDLCSHAGESFL